MNAGKLVLHTTPVVCLCGSTRFMEAYHEANRRFSLAGCIVLSVEISTYDGSTDPQRANPEQKALLDNLHNRKIDIADFIYVLDVDGYIGESTRNEIAYARLTHKPVRYLTDDLDLEAGRYPGRLRE